MGTAVNPLPTNGIEPRPILSELSVVIPTLGRAILQESLSWIAAGSTWPARVIVVDQGAVASPPDWLGELQEAGLSVTHVPSGERGRSAGINRGLERVMTPFVAVTDDDCFVHRDWLRNMLSALLDWPDAIVTGRVTPAGDETVEFCTVTLDSPVIYRRPQLKVHPLIGGNMGVSMVNVQRVGPFDEHPALHAAEDSDWGYRALRLGIPITYRPEIVVRHFNWRSEQQRADRYQEYSRSQGAFYGKHLLSGDWLIPLQACRGLARAPLRWMRGLFRGDADMADRGRADTVGLLAGVVAGLRARNRS
jgi:GT2 family glycosyltransferase